MLCTRRVGRSLEVLTWLLEHDSLRDAWTVRGPIRALGRAPRGVAVGVGARL